MREESSETWQRWTSQKRRQMLTALTGQQLQRDWSPARRAAEIADDAKARMANSSSGLVGGAAVGRTTSGSTVHQVAAGMNQKDERRQEPRQWHRRPAGSEP
ncbi:hypothetical protein Scep_026120 [Stephania cephalantha]|uniref:Uncharacterized protein n=1 Tax=Stephania cephalantha TaxID=152367 RepID=A0AAP0HS68_9MAGN